MDHGICEVVYLESRASEERSLSAASPPRVRDTRQKHASKSSVDLEIDENVKAFLTFFHAVHVCRTSSACLTNVEAIFSKSPNTPVMIVVQIPMQDEVAARGMRDRSLSPMSGAQHVSGDRQRSFSHGVELVSKMTQERISRREFGRLSVAALLTGTSAKCLSNNSFKDNRGRLSTSEDTSRAESLGLWTDLLNVGASDIMTSPTSPSRVEGLLAHAHASPRNQPGVHDSQPQRRTSWVGIGNQIGSQKPYAYLREAMVSSLMDRICDPEHPEDAIDLQKYDVSRSRRTAVANSVASWSFSAHKFDDDELLYAVFLMIQHVLDMPELGRFKLDDARILTFLLATRKVYNNFVIYHNFRHACDVTQAVFHFLVSTGVVPPLPGSDVKVIKNPVSEILQPFHALVLVISAIGHDVGHPGVNNAFLVKLNAPLAQLYNDRSVLESFHCAAFSQILRRYWPAAFSDVFVRKYMISSILSTDMGIHAQYISRLGSLQQVYASKGDSLDGISNDTREEYRDLLCCLLLKCADICNVARDHSTATRWATILTEEFAKQGDMEQELQLPTCLFGGPPVLNDVGKLGASQTGFMNVFAGPLFSAMSLILPGMKFASQEIEKNKAIWEAIINEEKRKSLQSRRSDSMKTANPSPVLAEATAEAGSAVPGGPPSGAPSKPSYITAMPMASPEILVDGLPKEAAPTSAKRSIDKAKTSEQVHEHSVGSAMTEPDIVIPGDYPAAEDAEFVNLPRRTGRSRGDGRAVRTSGSTEEKRKERKFSFKFWRKSGGCGLSRSSSREPPP